ncbi:hypothetical protein T484DRAFT_1798671, partial [Baffinella frigidus]
FLASASIQDTDLDAATGSGAADPCRNVPDPSSPELPPDSTWGADERCPSDGLVASSGRTIPTTSTLPRLVSMRGAVLADNAVSRPGTDAPCEAASYPFRGDAPGFRRASLAASDTFSGAVLENIRIPGIGGSTLARGTFTLRGELMHAFISYRVATEGPAGNGLSGLITRKIRSLSILEEGLRLPRHGWGLWPSSASRPVPFRPEEAKVPF